MSSKIEQLASKQLIKPPKWLISGASIREVIMGSEAYGCSTGNSDLDIYGIYVSPKDHIFPSLNGLIPGFDNVQRVDTWHQHHIEDKSAHGGKGQEYDLSYMSIVKFFALATENNPNIIDSLFVNQNCVLHCTVAGQMITDAKHLFLHKGLVHKFKGYAFSQLHKAENKNPVEGSKRANDREQTGMDTKFLYHVVRLVCEAEQALETGTIDLTRDAELYKTIRRGEWSLEQIKGWFTGKEKYLTELYEKSSLQYKPDVDKIRQVLVNVLEHHYGSISDVFKGRSCERDVLEKIRVLLNETA
jgi:predicted nucleotidyltransferase